MQRSAIETTSPEYEAHLKGIPTPGTHTAVKEVPKDEVERPDGKVQKGSQVADDEKPLTDVEERWKQAFELATDEGMSWDQIAKEMGIALNQTWMYVGKHCARLGIENPIKNGKKKAPAPEVEPKAEAPKEKPTPSEPETLAPIASLETEIITEGHRDFVKTSSQHTHTAVVNRDGRVFRFCFGAYPRPRDIETAVRNQLEAS